MSICSSSRPARRSVAAAWLWGAKGDQVTRGDPVRWTRREIWAPASPRRWAMPRDRPLYRAALPPPIITGPCIRPTAVPTTTATTARPPLTSRGTTILPEVRLSVEKNKRGVKMWGRQILMMNIPSFSLRFLAHADSKVKSNSMRAL